MRSRARTRAMRWAVAAITATWLAPSLAAADAGGAGTRAASFLQASGAPRWTAMGGAGLASGQDLASAAWNAAALAGLPEVRWSISISELPGGVQQSWAAVGGRHASGTRWGLSALHRDEGAIEGRDASNQPTQAFAAQSVALGLSLARSISPWCAVGGSARYVGEHIGDVHGNGASFGLGAQADLGIVQLAISGQDFGGGMRWQDRQWRMPATLGMGLALVHEASGLTLASDLLAPSAGQRQVRTGAEWTIAGRAALRAGWRHELGARTEGSADAAGFGVGFSAGGLWLDYAFESAARSDGVHRVGLSLAPARLGLGRPHAPEPGQPGFIGPLSVPAARQD